MQSKNLFDRNGRVYLVLNPDQYGNGIDLGYYREDLFGGIKAVCLRPYHQEKEFANQKDAIAWLKETCNEGDM